MQWNRSRNHRILLSASGFVILAMALVGPRWIWGLLGSVPLFAGLVGGEPLFQISGRGGRRPVAKGEPAPR
jgi:hypothetical protein